MKILHTSDLHIGSPLSSRLSPTKAQIRRRELLSTFDTLISEAKSNGCEVIIIAGDLFDSEKVTASAKRRVFDAVERAMDITFIYTSGNHEGGALECEMLPKNFVSLSNDGWSYHSIADVRFAARRDVGAGIFDTLEASGGVNIAILHGELRNYTDGAISAKEAAGRGLDYIALGHYHKYSEAAIDDKGVAVYSGAPHGRGFDETGKMGYVLIDTDTRPISHTFIPLSGRCIYEKEINVSGITRTLEIERLIENECRDASRDDLLRIILTGNRPLDFKPDVYSLEERFSKCFWHFEIKDATRVDIDVEAIKYDKTLKGEFIRTVLKDETLTDADKSKIIDFGIRALMGEIPDAE